MTKEDEELAEKWSRVLCLHPIDEVYCINNKGYCKTDDYHMYTGTFSFDILPILEAAYKLRLEREK